MREDFFFLKVQLEAASLHVKDTRDKVAEWFPPSGFLYFPTTTEFASGASEKQVKKYLKRLQMRLEDDE